MSTHTSEHEVLLYRVLVMANGWLSSSDIADRAGVARRTGRHHLARMTDLGIAERQELHDGYRYRLMPHPPAAEVERLTRAAEALEVRL